MMKGESRRRLGWNLPWGTLGMVVLVLMVEGFLTRHELDWAGEIGLNCRFAGQKSRTEAPDCAMLCLGDSQVKVGILPEVLEARLGRPSYNLAVLASPPPLSYFLLRRALEAGAKPEAILIGHMTLSPLPGHDTPHFQELLQPEEVLDLIWQNRDVQHAAELVLARLLPSVRNRAVVRTAILDAIQDRTTHRKPAGVTLREWADHRGALMVPENPEYQGQMEPHLKEALYSRPWYVAALNARYFRRIVQLAADRDIVVYWLVAPIVPEAQARRDSLNLDELHTRNIRELQTRFSNVVVIDARRAGFPASAFVDSCHLNQTGARDLTTAIAEALLRHQGGDLAGRDWIELTPDHAIARTFSPEPGPTTRR